MKHKRTLVLNADFRPIATISYKRALVLSFVNQEDNNKGLEPIDYYEETIKSAGNKNLPIPAVVRCPMYVSQTKKKIAFSKKNVFLRDGMTCCYCGTTDETGGILTYDHVIPRSAYSKLGYSGSPTNWNNIVTCCISCNRRKADRTPKEAKMVLLKEPKEPSPGQYILGIGPWTKFPKEWEPYITPLYKGLMKGNKT